MSWATVIIADLGRVVTGTTPPTNQRQYYDGVYPFIKPSDLEFDTYRIRDTATTLTDAAKSKFPNQFLPENAVTFTCIGSTVGKIGITTTDSFTNQQINSIVVNDEHDWRFVYYLLRYEIRRIRAMCSGVASPIINKGAFEKIKVNVPSELSVEQNIASILSAYDDLIENNRRRIHLLEQAARMLYKEWFVHLRFPGHEHVTITDGVPEGWERKPLGETVDVMKGKNITKASANDGSVPVVAGGLRPAYYHDTPNVLGPVITVSASGANAGYVNLYHKDIWASDCSYIGAASTEDLYYLYLFLRSKQKEILGFQKGTAQPHVYPKDLKRLSLLDPPRLVVELFQQSVSKNFLQVRGLLEQNKLLAKARDLLVPRLMNGELVA